MLPGIDPALEKKQRLDRVGKARKVLPKSEDDLLEHRCRQCRVRQDAGDQFLWTGAISDRLRRDETGQFGYTRVDLR